MAGRLQIEILAGPKVGESFDFDTEAVGMGRSGQCQLQIPSPHVSRKQCELTWQGDQLVLENLGSVNHTYLNDRPIDRAYVQDGDLVTFCDIALRVRIPGRAAHAAASGGHVVPPEVGAGDGATHVLPPPPPVPVAGPQDTHPPGNPSGQPYQMPPQPPHPPSGAPHPPGPAFAQTGQSAAVQPPGAQQPPYGGPGGYNPNPPYGGQQGGYPGVPQAPYPGGQQQGGYPPPGQQQGGYPPPGQQQGGYPPPGQQQGGHPPPGQQQGGQPPYASGAYQQAPGQPGPYVQRPAGMPGMPPGASSLQGGQGAPPPARSRAGARGKGFGNPQLLRNLVIVGGVLLVLLVIAAGIATRVLNQRAGSLAGAPQAPLAEVIKPIAERGDRSNEDILRQAQEDFQRGQVYFREAAVGDENLWESIRYYQRAEAELSLVDVALWPPFARQIAPKIQRAEGMLDQEYRRIKMSFVGYYQSADWRRADQELELLMRIIPDEIDPRHKYAKKNKAKVKKRLRSMPKKKGPL